MQIDHLQVEYWRDSESEGRNLEFKEAKQQFDFESLKKYCVAIANEGGGHLILGVSDKKPRRIVGSQAFKDWAKTEQQLLSALGFRVEMTALEHTDGRVVVFQIPARPRGVPMHVDGAYLMRAGSSLVPMTADVLKKVFAEGSPDPLEESAKNDVSATEVIGLLDTQTFFELLRIPYPTAQSAVLDRLVVEKLIAPSEKGYSITRLCALLLAKRLSDFGDVARKAPRVIVYSGTSKLQTKLDRPGTKGYAVGFDGLVQFIMAQLPQNEVIQGALRQEVKLVPEEVIRELVANALIHQDFELTGASVMIEIYQDRIELSNPGEPIVDTERFIDGYQSRNERLAEIMRRLSICEEKGSGIDRVVRHAEVYGLSAPDFRKAHQRTSVIIFGHKTFANMDRNERVRACYQHACLRWVMSERMTNQSLRERFSLSEAKSASVSQVIASTLDENLIKADEKAGESKKFARYLPFWA